jgi:hypothetical protein
VVRREQELVHSAFVDSPVEDGLLRSPGPTPEEPPRTFLLEGTRANPLRSYPRRCAYSPRAIAHERSSTPTISFIARPTTTHTREIDVPRLEVQVHEVESDPTLEVPGDPIDLDLSTDVDDLAPRDIGLGDGLIDALVLLDPLPEIPLGLFLAHVLVIGITGPSFEGDVGSDDFGIVTP